MFFKTSTTSLTFAGDGSVNLKDQTLDFTMRMNARGLLGLITLPLRPFYGMFQFRGTGPLKNPKWENVMFTAPTAVRMWMSHGPEAPARYDLSRLRLIACAGEPLNPEAHLWSQKHLVGQSNGLVVDNFWQTEIAGPVLGTLPTFDVRPGKVGKPLPGIDIDVVDALGW